MLVYYDYYVNLDWRGMVMVCIYMEYDNEIEKLY